MPTGESFPGERGGWGRNALVATTMFAVLLAGCKGGGESSSPEETGGGDVVELVVDNDIQGETGAAAQAELDTSPEFVSAGQIANELGASGDDYILFYSDKDGSGLNRNLADVDAQLSAGLFKESVEAALSTGDYSGLDKMTGPEDSFTLSDFIESGYLDENGYVHESTLELLEADLEAGDTPFHDTADVLYEESVITLKSNFGAGVEESGIALTDFGPVTIVTYEESPVTPLTELSPPDTASRFAAATDEERGFVLIGGAEAISGSSEILGLEPAVVDLSTREVLAFTPENTANLDSEPSGTFASTEGDVTTNDTIEVEEVDVAENNDEMEYTGGSLEPGEQWIDDMGYVWEGDAYGTPVVLGQGQ